MYRTELRKHIKKQCLQLNPLLRKKAASKVIDTLYAHPLIQKKHHIGAFLPLCHEVDIRPWFELLWKQGKASYLPITLKDGLQFGYYTRDTILQQNPWGILEPRADNTVVKAHALEVVLVPLVAFDAQGHRLGRGKGYYDRTFSFLLQHPRPRQPYLIGIAYACQKVDNLKPANWDVPLNEVITETQHYTFNESE